MIIVVDFGSQTAHLISRRIKELGSEVEILSPKTALSSIKRVKPQGIILSGGPSSVYEKGAPSIDPSIFSLDIPILGICYGLQLTAHLLDGKVIPGRKEYGPAKISLQQSASSIQDGLSKEFTVWMSHGDEVVSVPQGFHTIGSTEHVPFAFVEDPKRKLFGLQFHPEVEHTEYGNQILSNFVKVTKTSSLSFERGAKRRVEKFSKDSSRLREVLSSTSLRSNNIVKEIEDKIKKIVKDAYVIGAISGGVDSTVAGVLTVRAIGNRFVPVYINNGLMREGTEEHIKKIFTKPGNFEPIVVNAVGEMLERLKGITDPERKRKIIGNFYIELFEQEMKKLLKSGKPVKFLLQGTIYSDVIESGAPRRPDEASVKKDKGTKHAAKIKSHHNVGGLPKKMKLKLLEPLKFFYKDEVREIGRMLELPNEFVERQPFPGPGYAIRIRGEVTKERLEKERLADEIVLEELEKAGVLSRVFLSFPVLTGASSTAVKGDGRFFGEVVAIRVVESKDVMTSTWARLPYDVLQKISSRIVNEVAGISRVVYDITTKPPATMEWE